MKHIGHVDGAVIPPLTWKTHSLGMMLATDLFIPTPGERENVDATIFEHVGWVTPDTDGGTVWANRADADKDTRPAYVLRHLTAEPVVQPAPQADVAEDAHRRIDALIQSFNVLTQRLNDLKHMISQPLPAPAESPMTFYDHAFIAAYAALMQSASVYPMSEAIARAHSVAIELTRNRVNQL